MRKLITMGLLGLSLIAVNVQARDNDSHGRKNGHRHSHSRGSDLNPTRGRTYNNPEYNQFDSLYNPYYRNPFRFYPSFGWGYSPWFGYWPGGYNAYTALSIGTGYANSWYPGWMWH